MLNRTIYRDSNTPHLRISTKLDEVAKTLSSSFGLKSMTDEHRFYTMFKISRNDFLHNLTHSKSDKIS